MATRSGSSSLVFGAAFAFVLGWATCAAAQSSGYSTKFDDSTGWTLTGNGGTVQWHAGATPQMPPNNGKPVTTYNLSYNNDSNYDNGAPNMGTAASPVISLAGVSAPTLTFWCCFETEPGSEDANFGFDVRTLTVTPGTGVGFSEKLGVTNSGPTVGPCSAMGTWHQHTITLDPSWGTVHVTFKFDTIDQFFNTYKGWFIGSFSVGKAPAPVVTTVVQKWDFDTGLQGWTVQNTTPSVMWAADATPSTVGAGGDPSYHSGPNSLNYNNGVNYASGATANSGTATSPTFDLTGLTGPKLVFWCNYQTETTGTTYDQRWLQISKDNFATTLLNAQLAGTGAAPAVGNCATMGKWHTHTVVLDPTWGKVRFRVKFDTIDGIANNYAGWFIDDVQVTAIVTGGPVGDSNQATAPDKSDHWVNRNCHIGSIADEPGSHEALALAALLSVVFVALFSSRRLRA